MGVHSIVKNHIVNDAYIHRLVSEGRKKAKKQEPTEEPTPTQEPTEDKTRKVHYDSKFNRNIAKIAKNSNKADMEKVHNAINQLKNTGRVEAIGGIHSINQPIYSEITQTRVTGWRVIPISRKNEIRLAYKIHDDDTVEVKFGRPKDIGYTH